MRCARLLLAGAALSLVVSGCSGGSEGKDPEPRIAPTDSSSAASAPTPTGPVEPTLPPEAEGEDAAAAEAFVRFYWEMADYAQQTGDVSALKGLATASCVACAGGVVFVEKVYGQGGTIRGGQTRLSQVSSVPVRYAGRDAVQVKAKIKSADQVVDYPAGKEDERFTGGTVRASVIVERQESGWLVAFWELS